MAGAYPDVLANRMLLDVDGSGLYTVVGSLRAAVGPEAVVALNNESSDTTGPTTNVDQVLVAFPEHRNVAGLYLGFSQTDSTDWIDVTVEASIDTVTGQDGSWTELFPSSRVQSGATLGIWGHVADGDYRRYIQPCAAPETRVLRISIEQKNPGTTIWQMHSLHVFGRISQYEVKDRLALWHPTLDEQVSGGYFDWGIAPLSSSADRGFRVKNLSPNKRAEVISIFADALTSPVPSFASQLLFSAGGSSFVSNLILNKIEPGQTSSALVVRRVTPTDAVVGLWAARIRAAAAFWNQVGGTP